MCLLVRNQTKTTTLVAKFLKLLFATAKVVVLKSAHPSKSKAVRTQNQSQHLFSQFFILLTCFISLQVYLFAQFPTLSIHFQNHQSYLLLSKIDHQTIVRQTILVFYPYFPTRKHFSISLCPKLQKRASLQFQVQTYHFPHI